MHPNDPGHSVLAAFGVRHLARQLKVSPEVVSRWGRDHGTNKGTGGAIPTRYHAPIVTLYESRRAEAAQTNAEPPAVAITAEFLASKEQRKGGAGAKQKGDRFEREVINLLKGEGVDSHRVPLSGAVVGYPGDVVVTIGDRRILGQCKRFRDGAGYGAIETLLSEACMGLVGSPEWDSSVAFYAMDWPRFVALLKGERPAVANVPRLESTKLATVSNAIEGHDFLAFRRDRGPIGVLLQPEFYACSTAP